MQHSHSERSVRVHVHCRRCHRVRMAVHMNMFVGGTIMRMLMGVHMIAQRRANSKNANYSESHTDESFRSRSELFNW